MRVPGRDTKAPVLLAVLLVLAAIPLATSPAARAADDLVLRVGQGDEMKTRNPLPGVANDVWRQDVLGRVYDRVLKELPDGTLLAYVAKGVDANGDVVFESTEYGEWRKTTDSLNVTAYYDFNGVRWHDGVQADVWDLLFSYHLAAMTSWRNGDLRVLFAAGAAATYDDGARRLEVGIAAKSWDGESSLPGDAALRAAVRFRPTEPFARFYEATLAPVLYPMHVWSRTGGGRHADFGCAIWIPPPVASARGIPECGNPEPAMWGEGIAATDTVPGSTPFDDAAATAWQPRDADVIGTGPFRFGTWVPGVEASVVRYDGYYAGVDDRGTPTKTDDIVYDARLARVLKRPTIEEIRFKVYRTGQLLMFAVQNGEIDYAHWNVEATLLPDILHYTEIAVVANAEPGYTYVGYNLRRDPWGPPSGSSSSAGYWLRKAISHLIDKKLFVGYLLQNYGEIANSFITPANTFWYDDNIPRPAFNPAEATAVLDSAEARAAGIGPDPPGPCSKDTPSGCRSLPGIGNATFEILTAPGVYFLPEDPWGPFAEAMRQVGLNAVLTPINVTTAPNPITEHDFDMYVASWRLAADPDYLFDLFHSSNADAGRNYAGFENATFDALIEASRREMDREIRRGLVHDAQRVLLDARPEEPVFFRTNIEAYRQDRFVNWTVVSGTIWNEWSLFGIRPPRPVETPHITLSVASAVLARETVTVTARVTTPQGIALPGAAVSLSVSNGTLMMGAETGATVSGTADARGEAVAEYAAPDVDNETRVLVTTTVTHPDFVETGQATTLVYVFPGGTHFLSLTVSLPFGDIVRPGDSLPMRITVRDSFGIAVPDATVTVENTNASVFTANPANGTAEEMATVTLTANASLAAIATASVTVTAARLGYEPAEKFLPVSVVPGAPPTYTCTDGRIVTDPTECTPPGPAQDATPLLLAAGIGTAAGVAVAAVLLWRRHRGTAKR